MKLKNLIRRLALELDCELELKGETKRAAELKRRLDEAQAKLNAREDAQKARDDK